jgi:amidase
LVQEAGRVKDSFFVPHDLEAPIVGAQTGPLAGLTAVVKDWLAAHKPASRHAAAVEKILAAGATVTGKTICDEFFYSVSGVNAHYGTPANNRAPGRIPGGSSSGSAAACGANACDFALGSDTGGSVRVPASFNGVYGLRPTHGRVDLAGAMAMAPSFDVAGWFANGPGILRRVGTVLLQDSAVSEPITRLLVASDAFAQADDDVAALCREFLNRGTDLLAPAVEKAIAPEGFDGWREAFRVVQAKEVWETFGAFVTEAQPKLGPGIKERMEFAASVTGEQAVRSREILAGARAHILNRLPPGTVLALPSAPSIAPPLAATGEALEQFRVRTMRLTCIAGIAGLPQISIPIGTVAGCPAGLSFVGWPGGDEVLLELACRLAHLCGIQMR